MSKSTSSYWWSRALINLGIIGLVVFALYFTKSLWAFLGLFFLFYQKTTQIKTQCPKCEHNFVAVEKDEDDEEWD
ncbi:MAG: hypothetical protein HYT62_05320 [Candidatus Yanofskybacteria bacterium]|nr:hypothetical protein [Candidatus Yanofskybacteria bacterium]